MGFHPKSAFTASLRRLRVREYGRELVVDDALRVATLTSFRSLMDAFASLATCVAILWSVSVVRQLKRGGGGLRASEDDASLRSAFAKAKQCEPSVVRESEAQGRLSRVQRGVKQSIRSGLLWQRVRSEAGEALLLPVRASVVRLGTNNKK